MRQGDAGSHESVGERLGDDVTDAEQRQAVASYNSRVGERLRATRRAKKMSLQEVEGVSIGEFKASVLGAYERGERSISVPRLWRLAGLYCVEVTDLLPPSTAAFDAAAATIDQPFRDFVDTLSLTDAESHTLKRFFTTLALALEAGSEPSPDESGRGSR